MRNSFPIARLFGIDLRADFSWLIAFGLVVWSLGGYYFPAAYPELTGASAWSLAFAATVFLFVSIVAHELGHSLVSIKTGVPVRNITLFIFGGLAQISRQPRRARDELLMALAGPAVSFGLALGFGALGWAGAERVGLHLAAFGRWLGVVNFWLAAFNLIPGFPLDGGRVLRAAIWGWTGNFRRATKIAGFSGQMAAAGFIAWGVLQIFDGNWADGLWIAFIGWFLQNAAAQSVAQVALKDALAGHTAREIMQTDCPRVAPTMTLDHLVYETALPSGRHCFPVGAAGRATGLITLHEVRAVPRQAWADTTVGTAMKLLHELETVSPDTELYEVLEKMTHANVAQAPVIEDGKLQGLVTRERILGTLRARSRLGL